MPEIKKIHLVYFSPSGSTEKIVKKIATAIPGIPVETYDFLRASTRKKKYVFENTDLVIFGSMTAGKLFAKADEIFDYLEGNNTPFIGIITYGNGYYGIALTELQEKAENHGFKIAALGAFIARHSVDVSIAEGRPDSKDEEIMFEFGRKAYEKILNDDLTLHNLPKTNWSSIEQANKVIEYRENHRDESYSLPPSYKEKSISDACIQCGICARNCPVNAINIENKTFDLEKCIACWGCINRCPRHAITSTSKEMNEIMKTFSSAFEKRLEPEIFM